MSDSDIDLFKLAAAAAGLDRTVDANGAFVSPETGAAWTWYKAGAKDQRDFSRPFGDSANEVVKAYDAKFANPLTHHIRKSAPFQHEMRLLRIGVAFELARREEDAGQVQANPEKGDEKP